ncbi:uncharacterized protein LOC143024156 isoform X2 [Oratosquilla oratoria]|uniref:uncharacterized protein LOC143024156 isoform X2 n=1 Tax=Oratosquilla oratoria TaxID=337810 RepID=UPI003F75BA62
MRAWDHQQAGGNVGQEEEETTLPYVFTETPRVMYTVQARSYITPWQTVYKGCGRGCNVTGRTPGQLCQVRVRASAPGVVVRATSPWSLVNATTKEVPGSGLSLLEGLREKDGPQIRDALAQLAKYSQLERMDAVVSEIGRNPLGEAIAASRARGREGVAVLLERKAACDVRSAGANFTPVMLAAVFGCHDICSRLESAGACWNARDRVGLTGLHYAIAGRRRNPLEAALADSSSSSSGFNPSAESPLAFASRIFAQSPVSLIRTPYVLLPESPEGGEILQGTNMRIASASKRGDTDNSSDALGFSSVLDLLLEGDAPGDQRGSPHGHTALHMTVLLHMPAVAQRLVNAGGHDPNGCSDHGLTPEHLAGRCGYSLVPCPPRNNAKRDAEGDAGGGGGGGRGGEAHETWQSSKGEDRWAPTTPTERRSATSSARGGSSTTPVHRNSSSGSSRKRSGHKRLRSSGGRRSARKVEDPESAVSVHGQEEEPEST